MISERRAFPKAVTLSMVAHIAIFGSALAFAQYAGDALRFSGAVITVALVSDGEGGAAVRRLGADTVRRMPADPDPMPPAVTGQEAEPVRSGDDRTEGTAAPADGSNGAGTFSAGKGEGTNAAADSGADNGMGGFSSEQWRLLYSAIEQAKTYPRLARERGIEGTVLVRFKVLPSGTVETVDVVKSSGAAVLDEASIRTVYRAAPMPFVNGWIEVPMVYELK